MDAIGIIGGIVVLLVLLVALRTVRIVASWPSGTNPIPAVAAGLAVMAGGVAVARLIGNRLRRSRSNRTRSG